MGVQTATNFHAVTLLGQICIYFLFLPSKKGQDPPKGPQRVEPENGLGIQIAVLPSFLDALWRTRHLSNPFWTELGPS